MVTHVTEISTPPTPADPPTEFEQKAAKVWSELHQAVPQMNQQADDIEQIGAEAQAAKERAIQESDAALGYRNETQAARDAALPAALTATDMAAQAVTAKEQAEDARDDAQAAAESAANRVAKTSDTGAALLPEGNDAQRPVTGSIPAGAFVMRGSTQAPADYQPEFWNRVAAAWQAFASRPWVAAITDALIARIAALESRQLPLGQGQTLQDMAALRVANTNYTNNTGRTIAVFAALGFGAVQSTRILVAGVVAGQWVSAGSSVSQGAFAIIPAGSLYQVRNEQGGGTVQLWTELRT